MYKRQWYRGVSAGVTQFQFLHPFCRNGHSFVWTFNEHVSADLEGYRCPDLKSSIVLFSGQFLLRDTCVIEHHVSSVVSVNRLSDIAIPVHIGVALYWAGRMSFDQQIGQELFFPVQHNGFMVKESKRKAGVILVHWICRFVTPVFSFWLDAAKSRCGRSGICYPIHL